MKKTLLGSIVLGIMLLSCAENSETLSESIDSTLISQEIAIEEPVTDELAFNGVIKGDFTLFGHEDISKEGAVSPAEMFDYFEANNEFSGKLNVTINEVCQKAGCWINFKKNEDETVMVFFRDHFNIPIEESAGKDAVLYGNLVTDTLSVDFQRHLLDDAAEAGQAINQEDYDAITEEKIDVSFDCISILIN
ncbi:MAG: DUF4920 domain-containing protein [Crocinitomicaceae bacterium]